MTTFLLTIIAISSIISTVDLIGEKIKYYFWKKRTKKEMSKAQKEWEEQI